MSAMRRRLICTTDLPKIAEARVAYGGRGVLTNTQQVPWGQQASISCCRS
jgi:hypothetical protein